MKTRIQITLPQPEELDGTAAQLNVEDLVQILRKTEVEVTGDDIHSDIEKQITYSITGEGADSLRLVIKLEET